VQNLGDLGSEIPGLVLAGVVCAAIVVAGTRGDHDRWRVERWGRAPRAIASGGCVATAVGIALAGSGVAGELHADQLALFDAATKQRVDAPAMHAAARAAMLRHPAEPYLPFIVGLRASSMRDDNPIPWLGAALERARVYAPAHMVLARTMAARSPSQARLEYRLAIEQAPELSGHVMNDAPPLVHGFVDAMELVPDGREGLQVLETLVRKLKDRLPATSVRLDADLAARAPTKAEPTMRAAEAAVDDVGTGAEAAWCTGVSRQVCLRDALAEADRAMRLAPSECEPHVLRARARVAAGEVIAALNELQTAADAVAERVDCLQALEGVARSAGDEAHANAALDEVARAGCSDDRECAHNLWWVGARQEATGNPRKALVMYKRAYERTPENDDLLENAARLAVQTGLHNEAADSYEKLARKHPLDARWLSAVRTEREAAARSVVLAAP
jgi:tetratricopeptide (TPR) repeat protein